MPELEQMPLEPSFQINIYQGLSIPWCCLTVLLASDIPNTYTIPLLPLPRVPIPYLFTWSNINFSSLSSKCHPPMKSFFASQAVRCSQSIPCSPQLKYPMYQLTFACVSQKTRDTKWVVHGPWSLSYPHRRWC